MGRPSASKNRFYHFEVFVDDKEPVLLRTMVCVANHLGIGRATVQRKLVNENAVINKYKSRMLVINRVHLPIFQRADVEITY